MKLWVYLDNGKHLEFLTSSLVWNCTSLNSPVTISFGRSSRSVLKVAEDDGNVDADGVSVLVTGISESPSGSGEEGFDDEVIG